VSCELGVSRGVFKQVQRMTNGLLRIAFLGTPLAIPTVKITLGTPFPGVPAGNDS